MATAFWKQSFHTGRRLLAKTWLKLFPQLTVIGVTGSYGKTSTTRAIATVLSEKSPTIQTELNLDTVYNIPITLLKLRPQHKFLILEMGVDHRGDMSSYLKLVKPVVGIITGITPVHSEPDLLGSLEGICEEKGKLLEALPVKGWAILNRDDGSVCKMAKITKAKVLWYSLNSKADFWADGIKLHLSGTSFVLHYQDPFDGKELVTKVIKIPLLGKHFIHAVLVAFAVGRLYGLKEEEIISGLAKLKPLPGRMSLEKGPLGTVLLDDHLRANPASALAGLETLDALPCPSGRRAHRGRKIAILGEMGELGQYAQEEHRRLGRKAGRLKIDFLIGVGPMQKLVIEECLKNGLAKNQVLWVENVRKAAGFLKTYLKQGDLIYLKGSLLRHMERVILILKGENVCCDFVVCPHYNPCSTCPKLAKVG